MAHGADEHNPRKIDRELRDMISSLTHHLAGISKDGGGGGDRGLGMVTLAGSNKGAVMKADMLDDQSMVHGSRTHEHHHGSAKRPGEAESKVSAYTNSNYQAVNNSIMVDGRCEAEDPGVHIEIVDCMEDDEEEDDDDDNEHEKEKKKEKKKKEKKEKHSEGKKDWKGSDNE